VIWLRGEQVDVAKTGIIETLERGGLGWLSGAALYPLWYDKPVSRGIGP